MPSLNTNTLTNLKIVRDAIAADPDGFNMNVWCEIGDGKPARRLSDAIKARRLGEGATVADIGGTAEALLFPEAKELQHTEDVGAALGLDEKETHALFFKPITQPGGEADFDAVSAEHAVLHLDMIRSGLPVDWLAVFRQAAPYRMGLAA